jgi:hypothetical protein
MSALITLIWDLIDFARQLIPSPISLFCAKYRFSPSDLALPPAPDRPGGAAAPAPLATVDVLSYNVNNAAVTRRDRRGRIIRAITSSGADVVLLQETNPAWEAHLLDDATDIPSTVASATLVPAIMPRAGSPSCHATHLGMFGSWTSLNALPGRSSPP